MRAMRSIVFGLAVVFVVAACSSSPSPETEPVYTLAVIRTGVSPPKLEKEARAAMFQGHFANMGRLAGEGKLVVAGPYGKTKTAPDLRGLFVLDTADEATARAWAETDPGFQQGEFRFEYHRLQTGAPLRAALAADLAAEEEAKQSGRTPEQAERIRPYVWVLCEDHDRAKAALGGHPSVLLFAREDAKAARVLLDAADAAAAEALLAPLAEKLGPHRQDEWYASRTLATLPTLGTAAAGASAAR